MKTMPNILLTASPEGTPAVGLQRLVSRLLGKYEILSLQTREAETQMLDSRMAYEDLKRDRDVAYQKYYNALKPRKPANIRS